MFEYANAMLVDLTAQSFKKVNDRLDGKLDVTGLKDHIQHKVDWEVFKVYSARINKALKLDTTPDFLAAYKPPPSPKVGEAPSVSNQNSTSNPVVDQALRSRVDQLEKLTGSLSETIEVMKGQINKLEKQELKLEELTEHSTPDDEIHLSRGPSPHFVQRPSGDGGYYLSPPLLSLTVESQANGGLANSYNDIIKEIDTLEKQFKDKINEISLMKYGL